MWVSSRFFPQGGKISALVYQSSRYGARTGARSSKTGCQLFPPAFGPVQNGLGVIFPTSSPSAVRQWVREMPNMSLSPFKWSAEVFIMQISPPAVG